MSAEAISAICHPLALFRSLRRSISSLRLPGRRRTRQNNNHTTPTRTKRPRNRLRRRSTYRSRPTSVAYTLENPKSRPPTAPRDANKGDLVVNNSTPYHWKRDRRPVEPFTLHLPDDVLRTIFEYAAINLETAYALCLVATHVRRWVDPVLYSRVRLEGLESIRLFARTIEETLTLRHSHADVSELPVPSRIAKGPSFFNCVRSLALIPQEERVLLFFRDTVRSANIIMSACNNLVELECSGDFLRRTGVSNDQLEPPDTAGGDGDSAEASTGAHSAGPSTPIVPQPGLQRAAMRPGHLTLVPPIQNVNFKLAILSNVTHLHYSADLPRALNCQGVLSALTHVAFDYSLGSTTAKASSLLQLVQSALDWGSSPLVTQDSTDLDPDSSDPLSNDLEPSSVTPKLIMVVVRVLLKPLMVPSDRAGDVWRRLASVAQTEPRLVYFESQGLFGENLWDRANDRLLRRQRLSTSWYREPL